MGAELVGDRRRGLDERPSASNDATACRPRTKLANAAGFMSNSTHTTSSVRPTHTTQSPHDHDRGASPS